METYGSNQEPELRITAVQDPPYLSIHQLPDGSFKYDGYLYDIWKIVAESLNLRYRLMPLLGGFGRLDENGTWSGMVGELAYGRADVALTWLRYRKDRSAVIDYIDAVPIDKSEDTFYLSKDLDDSLSLTGDMFSSLLKPLHTHVWWVLLATLLVLSLVLGGSTRFSRAETDLATSELTWETCLFSSFMSLVGQGWTTIPNSLSGRTVTIFTWLLCMIISTSYTANLISYLTVVTVDRPISSLKEFSEQSDWRLAVDPGHIVVSNWRVSRDPYEQELYQRFLSKDIIALDRSRERVLRLFKPKVLTYVDINILFFLIGDKACSMIPLYDQPVKGIDNYIVIAKGKDKLRDQMNKVMTKITEAGIIQQLKRRWIKHKNICVTHQGFVPVSLGNALDLVIIMPLGFVASIIILLLEVSCYNCATRRAITYALAASVLNDDYALPNRHSNSRQAAFLAA